MYNRPRRSFAPIREGEELDVKIESAGKKGDGIAKVKGFVIFIPNVKEGDEVRIKVTRVLNKVGFGEVIGEAQKTEGKTDKNDDDESDDKDGSGDEDAAYNFEE